MLIRPTGNDQPDFLHSLGNFRKFGALENQRSNVRSQPTPSRSVVNRRWVASHFGPHFYSPRTTCRD